MHTLPPVVRTSYARTLSASIVLVVATAGTLDAQTPPTLRLSVSPTPIVTPARPASGTGSASTAAPAAAGATTPLFDLELSVPDSPAFMILGVSPTQIARPTTPMALAVSVATSAAGSSNFLPTNYALEVAPYWMGRHELQMADYQKPGIVQSMAQTMSLSFATAKSGTGIPAANTGVAFGFNVALAAGEASAAFREGLAEVRLSQVKYLGLKAAILMLTTRLNDAVSAYTKTHLSPAQTPTADEKAAFDKLAGGFGTLPMEIDATIELMTANVNVPGDPDLAAHRTAAVAALKKKMQAVYKTALSPITYPLAPLADAATRLLLLGVAPADGASAKADVNFVTSGVALARILEALESMKTLARNSLEEQSAAIQEEDKLRRGFMFAVSGAAATNIPDKSFTDAKLARWGVWFTPAWRFDPQPIEIVGVIKVIHRPLREGPNLFDIGGRIIQHFKDVSWSAEFLQRLERDEADASVKSQRLTANFEYKFREQMFLTAAFGKDFADPRNNQPKGGLLSILGINFGFGKKPTIGVASDN